MGFGSTPFCVCMVLTLGKTMLSHTKRPLSQMLVCVYDLGVGFRRSPSHTHKGASGAHWGGGRGLRTAIQRPFNVLSTCAQQVVIISSKIRQDFVLYLVVVV